MKASEVNVYNYKSIIPVNGECKLLLDKKVTFLIGANESGKTNLLEAMWKFSVGGFQPDDIPHISKWCGNQSPPSDLEMVSTTFIIEPADREYLSNIHKNFDGIESIKFTRYYSGSPRLVSPEIDTEKDLISLLNKTKEGMKSFETYLRRYIRKYKKVNKERNIPFSTRSVLMRLNVLREYLSRITEESSKDDLNIVYKKERKLKAAILSLPNNLESVDQDIIKPLSELDENLYNLIVSIDGTRISSKIWDILPKFTFIPADPKLWLSGEYNVTDIIHASEKDEELLSIKRLLSLADIDIEKTRNLTEVMQSRTLERAGDKVTNIIQAMWPQEKEIKFKLRWSPNVGNEKLLVMIESPGHLGYPQSRSLGFRWFLEFYLVYASAQSKNQILLFEEPGVHLHPIAQNGLKQVMRDEVAQNNQVVYTTHLPEMYDQAFPEGCRAIIKEVGMTKVEDKYSPNHQYATWEVALRALGINSPMLRLCNKNIITEGPSDWIFLLGFARIIVSEEPKVSDIVNGIIHIHPAGRASKIRAIAPFFFQPGIKSVILLDSDNAGKLENKYLQDSLGIPNEYITKIIMTNEVLHEVDGKDSGDKESELEDLLGHEYYATLVTKWLNNGKLLKSELSSKNKIASCATRVVKEKYDKELRKDEVAWIFYNEVKTGNIEVPEKAKERFKYLLLSLLSGLDT